MTNVKVREEEISNNQFSVMLDIHKDGVRTQKRIGIKYAQKPKTPEEREYKREQELIVKKMVAKIILDDSYLSLMIDKDYRLKEDFFDYCNEFITRKAPISDIRAYRAVLSKFKTWTGKSKLPCSSINQEMLINFRDFLIEEMNGVSANNYFRKFKRFFKEATMAKHFKFDPIKEIINVKGRSKEKDVLTTEEIKTLSQSYCRNEQVKRAFLFACFVGLRHCDLRSLKWENIKEDAVDTFQNKTGERVIIKLHTSTKILIGDRKNPKDLVFKLPSHTGCLKIIRNWVLNAGIEKHVTMHVSRKSFATALLNQGVDIFTVSKLLGHVNMMQTQTYLTLLESRNESAINKLPPLE